MKHPDRLRAVLDQLLDVLDQHRDTLWTAIDHRDPQAVEAGTARYRDFLARVGTFREAAAHLADFFDATGSLFDTLGEPDASTPAEPKPPLDIRGGERPTRRLDPILEHALDEDFTHTRPAALRIGDAHVDRVDSWRRLYELVLKSLAERDPDRFARLPTDPRFISARERHDFSRRQQDLRGASRITDDVYAEVHFSANDIRTRIVRLLDAFSLPASAVGIYLESDRPA